MCCDVLNFASIIRNRKTRVDEVWASAEVEIGDGDGGEGPEGGAWIDALARDLLGNLAELPFVPQLPIIPPAQPPPPGAVTLPPFSDLTRLRACLVPRREPEKVAAEVVAWRKPWRIEESIFALKVMTHSHIAMSLCLPS